jgi:hypothetical protein
MNLTTKEAKMRININAQITASCTAALHKTSRFIIILLVASFCVYILPDAAQAAEDAASAKKLKPNQVKLYEEDYIELLMMVEKTIKLPLIDYNNLLELVRKAEDQRKKDEEAAKKLLAMAASEKFSVTDGKLDCFISGEAATVKGSISVNLHGDGWKEIPLYPLPGIENITMNGKEALVTKTENGGNYQAAQSTDAAEKYSINTDEKGVRKIDFIYHPTVNLRNEVNRFYGSFTLESNQRVAFNVNITFPRGAEPAPALKNRMTLSKRGDFFTASMTTDFTEPLIVEWFVPRAVTQESLKPEYTGNFLSYFSFDESEVRLVTLASVEIITINPPYLEISLPEGFKYIDSERATGISVLAMEDGRKLRVILDESVTGFAQLLFFAEAKRTSDHPKIDPPRLTGAIRQAGWIAVKSEEFTLKPSDNGDLTPADSRLAPSELSNIMGGQPDLAYKYRSSGTSPKPALLNLTSVKTADSLPAYVRELQYNMVYSQEGALLTEAQAILINNNKQFVKIHLPPGSELQTAFVNNKPVRPVKDPDDALLIPIKPKDNSQDGRVVLNFVFKSNLSPINEEGINEIILPSIDMPINYLGAHIYLPEGYEYDSFGGSMMEGIGLFRNAAFTGSMAVKGDISAGLPSSKVQQETTGSEGFYDEGGRVEGPLPVKITVPKAGIRLDFFDLLVMSEKPIITFEYEKN